MAREPLKKDTGRYTAMFGDLKPKEVKLHAPSSTRTDKNGNTLMLLPVKGNPSVRRWQKVNKNAKIGDDHHRVMSEVKRTGKPVGMKRSRVESHAIQELRAQGLIEIRRLPEHHNVEFEVRLTRAGRKALTQAKTGREQANEQKQSNLFGALKKAAEQLGMFGDSQSGPKAKKPAKRKPAPRKAKKPTSPKPATSKTDALISEGVPRDLFKPNKERFKALLRRPGSSSSHQDKGERPKPPPGFTPTPGSKVGSHRKRKPDGHYTYWYPGKGLADAPERDDHPPDEKPAGGYPDGYHLSKWTPPPAEVMHGRPRAKMDAQEHAARTAHPEATPAMIALLGGTHFTKPYSDDDPEARHARARARTLGLIETKSDGSIGPTAKGAEVRAHAEAALGGQPDARGTFTGEHWDRIVEQHGHRDPVPYDADKIKRVAAAKHIKGEREAERKREEQRRISARAQRRPMKTAAATDKRLAEAAQRLGHDPEEFASRAKMLKIDGARTWAQAIERADKLLRSQKEPDQPLNHDDDTVMALKEAGEDRGKAIKALQDWAEGQDGLTLQAKHHGKNAITVWLSRDLGEGSAFAQDVQKHYLEEAKKTLLSHMETAGLHPEDDDHNGKTMWRTTGNRRRVGIVAQLPYTQQFQEATWSRFKVGLSATLNAKAYSASMMTDSNRDYLQGMHDELQAAMKAGTVPKERRPDIAKALKDYERAGERIEQGKRLRQRYQSDTERAGGFRFQLPKDHPHAADPFGRVSTEDAEAAVDRVIEQSDRTLSRGEVTQRAVKELQDAGWKGNLDFQNIHKELRYAIESHKDRKQGKTEPAKKAVVALWNGWQGGHSLSNHLQNLQKSVQAQIGPAAGTGASAFWDCRGYRCEYQPGQDGIGALVIEGGRLPMPLWLFAKGEHDARTKAKEAVQHLRRGRLPPKDGVFRPRGGLPIKPSGAVVSG